jgi:arsenate reductase
MRTKFWVLLIHQNIFKTKIMYPDIENQINQLDINTVTKDRKPILKRILDYIQAKKDKNETIHLNFICTHNSRRSHLSQVWAQALANHYKISDVFCYSGGTEATALFPSVAEALTQSGFQIEKIADTYNPIYSIKFSENAHSIIGFSKTFDADFNPKSNFAAIMTCSSADVNCPFVPGAEQRIALTFEDPKAFDGTPQQKEKYLERSLEIATELKYVFSSLN